MVGVVDVVSDDGFEVLEDISILGGDVEGHLLAVVDLTGALVDGQVIMAGDLHRILVDLDSGDIDDLEGLGGFQFVGSVLGLLDCFVSDLDDYVGSVVLCCDIDLQDESVIEHLDYLEIGSIHGRDGECGSVVDGVELGKRDLVGSVVHEGGVVCLGIDGHIECDLAVVEHSDADGLSDNIGAGWVEDHCELRVPTECISFDGCDSWSDDDLLQSGAVTECTSSDGSVLNLEVFQSLDAVERRTTYIDRYIRQLDGFKGCSVERVVSEGEFLSGDSRQVDG